MLSPFVSHYALAAAQALVRFSNLLYSLHVPLTRTSGGAKKAKAAEPRKVRKAHLRIYETMSDSDQAVNDLVC
jgi:hypothetical protein